MAFSIDRMLGVVLETVLKVKNLIGSCSAVGLQSYDPVNRVVTWNVRMVIYMCTLYNLPLIPGRPLTSFKRGKGLGMRGFYDRILVVSADWENPAPEIPVSEWKCEFTEEGREGRGGGERDRKQYSYLRTRSS